MSYSYQSDNDHDDEETSGKGLRSQLESTIEANKKLTEEIRGYRVAKAIASGSDLVTPEDFEGVDLDEIENHATALQEARAAQANQVITKFLESKGLDPESIEKLVETEKVEETEAAGRLLNVANTIGTSISPSKVNTEGMTPKQKIAAGITAQARK